MREKLNTSLNFDQLGLFRGYDQSKPSECDELLARVGIGTLGGEYLRCFWHPVLMTQDLGELPKAIRILGEDLVLFRYGPGREKIGLVHKHCPHRRASLEYGKCEDKGIRCCYHGWLFAPDGEILETPGENISLKPVMRVRERTRLGAYPVIEFNGLIFTYMGKMETIPEFPFYDAFEIDGITTRPYEIKYSCNWIQIVDAIMDPVHTSFLHSQNSRPQFSDGMAELGALKFYERNSNHFLGSSTRRVGDNVWVRVNELILPNFTQAGAAFAADGTQARYFGRSAFTRWVVPIDDENAVAYAWGNFGKRADPEVYNTKEGCELIEQGEVVDRTSEEKQRFPADAEAVEGMGCISTHMGENLMPTDRGISLYRRRIRRQINDLSEGKSPPQPLSIQGMSTRTYGQDTVLCMPAKDNDDLSYLLAIGEEVMDIQFAHENDRNEIRDKTIIKKLKALENNGLSIDHSV